MNWSRTIGTYVEALETGDKVARDCAALELATIAAHLNKLGVSYPEDIKETPRIGTIKRRGKMNYTWNEAELAFEALQKVTGQDLNGNENFIIQNGQLVYGDDWQHLVTQEHYNQAEKQTGIPADEIEEIALEFFDGGRCWSDLEE